MTNASIAAPILFIDPEAPEPALIEKAAHELRAQRLLVVPTDTVYGIAQLVSCAAEPEDVARAKQRPAEKGIPLLIANPGDLERYGSAVPNYARDLAAAHWPGALTLVVHASPEIPPQFVSEDGSVALRVPAHTITLALLEAAGAPLACSSANLAGQPPATTIEELDPLVAACVALIVDGGPLSGGVASTVVSCLGEAPLVLRPGPVTL